MSTPESKEKTSNFIHNIIEEDIKNNKNGGNVHTRFPPEPNGYLHIGHAKAICIDFGTAQKYNGLCNLRFDDTNPTKEDVEYVDSIQEDVKWLGFDWEERCYYASDYADEYYKYAVELIEKGLAYVDHLSADEIREYRGAPKTAGKESPYRNRSVEENLELFEKMKNGEFKDGECILRAKIDMASPNINMRDPAVFRIKHAHHHRTGDKWCIYPMYDFAHCIEDAIEGITHSLCTLEFENHRPLYDWFLDNISAPCHPQQIEFNRLNLTYTVMSKRKLLELVENKIVDGWDDPRLPTICGLRRRGYSPSVIRNFCEQVGVSKTESIVDLAFLHFVLREEYNKTADRVMVVLDPVKVVIDNYPDDLTEEIEAINNPELENPEKRMLPFSKEIYIERSDFMVDAPKKYFRLSPGKEVRLKHAYYVTCTDYIKDEKTGEVKEIHCTYDPESKGGGTPDGRKVKGTLHWVSAKHADNIEVRQYDNLFSIENLADMEEGKDYTDYLNPESLVVLNNCKAEPGLGKMQAGIAVQFMRHGYYCIDSKDSSSEKLVFNRTVTLKDSWAKLQKKMANS